MALGTACDRFVAGPKLGVWFAGCAAAVRYAMEQPKCGCNAPDSERDVGGGRMRRAEPEWEDFPVRRTPISYVPERASFRTGGSLMKK